MATPSQVLARHDAIPREREIVLFCNCPGEASAVALAVKLRRLGIDRVHPLEGGVDAWTLAGYPLEPAIERSDAWLHPPAAVP